MQLAAWLVVVFVLSLQEGSFPIPVIISWNIPTACFMFLELSRTERHLLRLQARTFDFWCARARPRCPSHPHARTRMRAHFFHRCFVLPLAALHHGRLLAVGPLGVPRVGAFGYSFGDVPAGHTTRRFTLVLAGIYAATTIIGSISQRVCLCLRAQR